jgi:hypothetical protein
MLNSLRRIYLYFVAAASLIIIGYALNAFLSEFLLNLGLKDYPDQTINSTSVSNSLIFLTVVALVVLPLGGLHYFFIWKDNHSDPIALQGVVRELFLDILVINYGSQLAATGAILAYMLFATNTPSFGLASFIASAITNFVILGVLLYERHFTREMIPVARGFSVSLFYLRQLGFLIASLAVSSAFLGVVFVGSRFDKGIFAAAIVLLISLAGFIFGTRHDIGSIFRQLADGAFLIVGMIFGLVGLIMVLNTILNLATGQISDAGRLAHDAGFAPLICGVATLAFFLVRSRFTPEEKRQQTVLVNMVAIALPLTVTFFGGMAAILASILLKIEGENISTSTLLSFVSIVIGGSPWIVLWPILARISDPHGQVPMMPRRIYVYLVLSGSVLSSALSLTGFLYFILTGIAGTNSSTTTRDGASITFSVALVLGAVAAYYTFMLIRDQRILKELAPPPSSQPAPAVTMTTDEVLNAVAAGQLTPDQASAYLKNLGQS